MAGEAPTSGQPLHLQFRSWRERDWKEGKPPDRPSPYWFALATDAIWMTLSLFEQAIVLMDRMAYALEHPAKPKEVTPLPAEVQPTGASGGTEPSV